MGATTSQGKSFALFLVGLTIACAGIASFSTGTGKLEFFIGAVAVAISLIAFLKIKPIEGKTGASAQPIVLQLAGIASVLVGWYIVLIGIHLTASVGGRLATSVIGLAISLVGMLYFLPAASRKNAIWKA